MFILSGIIPSPSTLAKGPIESQQPFFLVHHVFVNFHATKPKEGKRNEDSKVPMRKGKAKVMNSDLNITRTCWPGDACKGTKKINIKRRNKNRRDTASNLRAMLGKWEGPRAWSKYQTSTNDKSKRKGTVCTPVKPAKPVGRRFKTIRTIVCSRLVFPFSVSLSLSLYLSLYFSRFLFIFVFVSLFLFVLVFLSFSVSSVLSFFIVFIHVFIQTFLVYSFISLLIDCVFLSLLIYLFLAMSFFL